MKEIFKFKKFHVAQDKAAMKIGTDSVLLGAWTSIDHRPQYLLDIGSGTGVLSLIMAQRNPEAFIDAVEIDEDAYSQSLENFNSSSWKNRLSCYHADFKTFFKEIHKSYDLILTNPPFFSCQRQKSVPTSRQIARFEAHLPFEVLLGGVNHLLTEKGKFSLVLPHQAHKNFIDLAALNGLFLHRLTRVKGNAQAPVKRCLMEFGKKQVPLQSTELIIETDQRHRYTAEYVSWVKGFYLHL